MLRNPGLRKSVEQPVLDLNFAASQIGSNAAPDSRIDFSRGTNAWFVDSDGLVKKSPHNLLLQSEDFGTSWTANGDTTVATNQIVAPDGTTTADKISSADFSTGANHVRQQVNLPSGTVNMSVFVKDGGLGTIKLRTITLSPSTSDNSSSFTFSSESWTSVNANHTNTFVESYGNGWYRIGFDVNNPATGATGGVQMRLSAASGNGFIYLWGAQISQHTTLPVDNPYVKTEGSAVYAARLDHDPTWFMSAAQEQNLLEYSEMLDDSGWTKLGGLLQVTANAEEAPDGTTTAEYIFANSPSGQFPQVHQDFDAKNGATHTLSFYAKAAERDVIKVNLSETDGTFVSNIILETGISTTEWTRFSATFTASSDAHRVVFLIGDGAQTWSGSQGLYLWGVQIEVGSTAGTYHRTEGAPYYGEGATPKGLLIEEARTNLLDSSNDLTVDDGLSGGITSDQNAALGLDGTVTAAKLKANSTTPTNPRVFFPGGGITLSAADYTYSIFLKKAELNWVKVRLDTSGSFDGVFFDLDNGTVGTASTGFTGKIVEYGNGWYRCSITAAASVMSASTFFAGVHLASADNTVLTSATVGDGVFMWGHSLELGSFPTSYIENISDAAGTTRNADVAVMGPTTGGTELVTNGTFDTDSDWTKGDGWSISGGVASVDGSQSANSNVRQSITTVVGRRYRASVDVTALSHNVRLQAYMGVGDPFTDTSSTGTITLDFTSEQATENLNIWVTGNVNATATIDNVSVRELYPFEQYNPAEGTLYSLSSCTGDDTHTVLSVHADSFDNYFSHTYRFGNSLRNFSKGGGSTELQTAEAVTLSNRNEIATTYDGTSMDTSVNGSDETTGTLGADIVGIHEIAFGLRYTANQYSGHIERVQYFPRALPKVTLQSLTSD